MSFKKYMLASFVMAVMGGANAADGTITFNGMVTDSACTTITSVTADSVVSGTPDTPITATLTLPPVSTTAFNATTGTYVGQTPFSIQLAGCEATTSLGNVRALFTTASAPSGDAHVMENVATDAPATNVAVAIMQQNGTTQIDLNGGPNVDPGMELPENNEVEPVTAGPVTLNYKAAYKSLSDSVTPGKVTGIADFVISYF